MFCVVYMMLYIYSIPRGELRESESYSKWELFKVAMPRWIGRTVSSSEQEAL
jgi:hypothetical protein